MLIADKRWPWKIERTRIDRVIGGVEESVHRVSRRKWVQLPWEVPQRRQNVQQTKSSMSSSSFVSSTSVPVTYDPCTVSASPLLIGYTMPRPVYIESDLESRELRIVSRQTDQSVYLTETDILRVLYMIASWNSLPQSFRDATLIHGQFQRRLKTSVFRSAYGRDLTSHLW